MHPPARLRTYGANQRVDEVAVRSQTIEQGGDVKRSHVQYGDAPI